MIDESINLTSNLTGKLWLPYNFMGCTRDRDLSCERRRLSNNNKVIMQHEMLCNSFKSELTRCGVKENQSRKLSRST